MRNISPAGLAKLATRLGNEPITIIEVDWAPNYTRAYADRDVGDIPGRIIEVGDLDNVVNVSASNSSQSLNVTIDDTDGTLKAVFDGHDIHKRNARVYQYFEGLDLTDKFLLFAGKVSSPITWNERDRTVKFTIVSQLEDREVGFSAEEGQFPYLPADLVGKPWPMIFGTVQDCPALQVNHAVQGTTLTGAGVVAGQEYYSRFPIYNNGSNIDDNVGVSLAQISAQLSVLWCAEACANWAEDSAKAKEYLDQINELERQRTKIVAQMSARQMCANWQRAQQFAAANSQGNGANPIKVLGGEDFPQDTPIVIDINGAWFWGHFHGQDFFVTRRYCEDIAQKAANAYNEQSQSCPYHYEDTDPIKFDYRINVPCSCAWANYGTCECREYGWIIKTGGRSADQKGDSPILQQFWADAGATVRMHSDEQITYIVSIVPGTVVTVKAYKQFTGERRLVTVPTELYRVETRTYGTVSAVQLVFNKPLSTIVDQGWSDDIYVTFQSSVGPDTIDILKYLIDNYTDLEWDRPVTEGGRGTFDHVQQKLAAFPANFPILDRKNTLQVLQEIAFQARCALWISNGVFYIKYLPEEPAADSTITVSDLDADQGIEVELTPTEDLVTKMKVKWRLSWAPGATDRDKDKSEKTMILRHNVTRYGTQEQEYDWYIYNQPDTIYKCATFWLIRKSNTWKRIKFKTFLQKLNLETFDTVNLDFAGGYVTSSAVKAIVEQANYNSADNTVDFQCLVPVRAGEMLQYVYFWPSALPPSATWPPPDDVASNDAGGGGVGMGATGDLPVGDTSGIDGSGVVWVGGPNTVFRARSDWGDRHPTDVGFHAQQVINPAVFAELDSRPMPYLNLRTYTVRPSDPWQPPPLVDMFTIDLSKTIVMDSRGANPQARGRLKSVIRSVNSNGRLTLSNDALVTDSNNEESKAQLCDVFKIGDSGYLCIRDDTYIASDEHERKFDFKFDEEGGKFGAGTAFLQDS